MRYAAASRARFKTEHANHGGNANKACLLHKHLREVQAEQHIARLVPA